MLIRSINFWILLSFLLSACSSSLVHEADKTPPQPSSVPLQDILGLICGSSTNCPDSICTDATQCALITALGQPDIFNFVAEYSKCEGCSTPDFRPENGIGKCIEYEVSTMNSDQEVRFQVSENCNFRYANPEQVEVFVLVDTREWRIQQINPGLDYIQEPLYCAEISDCRSLSGSGVPFIGCSNNFYAPLNPSGYYQGEECGCIQNKCSIVNSSP